MRKNEEVDRLAVYEFLERQSHLEVKERKEKARKFMKVINGFICFLFGLFGTFVCMEFIIKGFPKAIWAIIPCLVIYYVGMRAFEL